MGRAPQRLSQRSFLFNLESGHVSRLLCNDSARLGVRGTATDVHRNNPTSTSMLLIPAV